jgi:1-acyl-sn-glycerol-3-phosphate acyltransferase
VLFPFTLLRRHGHTRTGLQDAARRLDRGRVLVSFPKGLASWHDYDPAHHARGVTRLAAEAGCPVVPIWVDADEPITWRWGAPRQRIHVSVGRPVMPMPGESPESVIATVEAAFARLASGSSA